MKSVPGLQPSAAARSLPPSPHFQPPVSWWGVYSVWRRHLTVYTRTWLVNFLPPVSEPLVYLIAFGYGLTPIVSGLAYQGETVTYLEFIAPGMIALGVLFQGFFEAAYGSFIRLNYQRTWEALLTAPLSFTDVFVGDWLWAATRGAIAGTVTGIVTVLLGFYPWWALLISMPLIGLGSLMFAAMGLISAGLVRTIDQINVPIFLFVIPMFTLCGTYFPRENLPTILHWIATVLPLSPLVDLLRWPLGLSSLWVLELVWMLGIIAIAAILAWRQIHLKIFG